MLDAKHCSCDEFGELIDSAHNRLQRLSIIIQLIGLYDEMHHTFAIFPSTQSCIKVIVCSWMWLGQNGGPDKTFRGAQQEGRRQYHQLLFLWQPVDQLPHLVGSLSLGAALMLGLCSFSWPRSLKPRVVSSSDAPMRLHYVITRSAAQLPLQATIVTAQSFLFVCVATASSTPALTYALRRSLAVQERVIFAPMSGVGGIVYDKDAVYIDVVGETSARSETVSLSATAI